jgi:hypothetical protein
VQPKVVGAAPAPRLRHTSPLVRGVESLGELFADARQQELFADARQQLAVDVERHRYGAVAHALLDRLWVRVLSDERGCVRVA